MRSGLLLGLALAAAWIVLRGRVDAAEVRGRPMAPALEPGDLRLLVRAPPRIGDVVLARDPRDPRRELIKRVVAIGPAGVLLRGDDPAFSTDARTFGAIPAGDVR